MQEVEAKFYVVDLGKIESRLQEMDAQLIQQHVFETNIRFDLPDASLRSEGRVLRLRQDTETRLTYKGASKNEQGVLSHPEIEFIVGDFDKAKQFLEALGYQPFFVYEKYRTTYAMQTSEVLETSEVSHVMLDELPYGNFVEIEGETIEVIRNISDVLNLKWDTAIATSYHALFERLCVTRPDLDPTQLTFASLNGLKIAAEELSVHAADA